MIALFRRYPLLAQRLPRLSLGQWPTPLYPLESLSHNRQVLVKNDGNSGGPYGGNKVRKLEFLLADARLHGCEAVATFGVAGSNHALATAIYAQQVGLRCYCLLTPQTNARYVGHNLLAGLAAGAKQVPCASEAEAASVAAELQQRLGQRLYVIPGGGSSPLGSVGFVNAAFELLEQLGDQPCPDLLYVALGTMGTAAGLALGFAAAGAGPEIVPVRVVRKDIGNITGFERLFFATARLLHELDPDFPLPGFTPPTIRHDQYGPKYAVFTPAGVAARQRLGRNEGLGLEGTYTGKTMAALLDDMAEGKIDGKRILYWHTYNSVTAMAPQADYRQLPGAFHRYFEQPVQPLDRSSP